MQLTDYLGAAGAGIRAARHREQLGRHQSGQADDEPGQRALHADSVGNLMQTEFNSLIWWAMHNGPGTSDNNSSSLYGWRIYGDYGIENGKRPFGLHGPRPVPDLLRDEAPVPLREGRGHGRQGHDRQHAALRLTPPRGRTARSRVLVSTSAPTATYSDQYHDQRASRQRRTRPSTPTGSPRMSTPRRTPCPRPRRATPLGEFPGRLGQPVGAPDVAANNYGQTGPFALHPGYSTDDGGDERKLQPGLHDDAVGSRRPCASSSTPPRQWARPSALPRRSRWTSTHKSLREALSAVSIYINGTSIAYTRAHTVTLNAEPGEHGYLSHYRRPEDRHPGLARLGRLLPDRHQRQFHESDNGLPRQLPDHLRFSTDTDADSDPRRGNVARRGRHNHLERRHKLQRVLCALFRDGDFAHWADGAPDSHRAARLADSGGRKHGRLQLHGFRSADADLPVVPQRRGDSRRRPAPRWS